MPTFKKQSWKDQKNYKSKHKYNLEKFGLTEDQIRSDCAFIYDTFFVSENDEDV